MGEHREVDGSGDPETTLLVDQADVGRPRPVLARNSTTISVTTLLAGRAGLRRLLIAPPVSPSPVPRAAMPRPTIFSFRGGNA
jgi:hypothetical protein